MTGTHHMMRPGGARTLRHCECLMGAKPSCLSPLSSNFRAGMALSFVKSILFFARGLDDRTDYLRMYHSGWHFFISAASFWLWRTVSIHEKKMHITAPGKTANDMM